MFEIIIALVFIVIGLCIIFYGSVFFIAAMGYAYWGFSIGMAPVLWILMFVGFFIGLVCAIRNALKAIRATYRKGVK